MVFTLQKYRHYLLANPFMFYTNHQALKYLVNKPLHHGRICRWLLLFQEFEFEVMVRPGKANVRPNHLSRTDTGEEMTRNKDDLPDAHLFRVEAVSSDVEEIAQFLDEGRVPKGMSDKKKNILAMKITTYTIVNEFLYKLGFRRGTLSMHSRE